MDLEKAYDTIDRHGMWQLIGVYGVGGKFMKSLQNFYEKSMERVQVGNYMSQWFLANDGLRQGCVMSP